MKKRIKKIIPREYYQTLLQLYIRFTGRHYRRSYSQSGEDMILQTTFCNVGKGIYVDVGANNPIIQSNTHFFYKKGWRGINIDALPGSMKAFQRIRHRDINLELPISDIKECLTYYMFSSSFYNSFSEKSAVIHKDLLLGTCILETKPLSEVLEEYFPNEEIHFLSVDVEGMDLRVIRSNDWERFRPKVVMFESDSGEAYSNIENEIAIFLEGKGYSFYCMTITNTFFIENEFRRARFNL